jgi:hypothetical protein
VAKSVIDQSFDEWRPVPHGGLDRSPRGKVRAVTVFPPVYERRKLFRRDPDEEAVQARDTGFRNRGGRGGMVVSELLSA